ncbi:transglycosylase SLT domain-containing protein [Halalkalibaculum sp. DA384]|uniref:transglycosylase SLT domain-containing protein n=1 Tax=Halalkalibaculum sp. DA384 TaxID=3373606 RepID=UPI0037552E8B
MASPANIANQLAAAREGGLLPVFRRAARRWKVPLEVLLAVASRETGMGTDRYYRNNGFTGRDGHGKGIMQIDDRYHHFATITAPNDHEQMIQYGARFLSELRDRFGSIKEALSAYNAGPDAVYTARVRGIDPDFYTTGGDYSRDVLARAEMIKKELSLGLDKAQSLIPAMLVLMGGMGYLYSQIVSTNQG